MKMRSSKSEESFPLLLLFLEDGRNSPRYKSGVFFDKNRYSKISEGANKVFTQWPGHVSSGWFSIIVFLLIFMLIFTIMLAVMIQQTSDLPHCTPYDLSSSNIKIYLVHCDNSWGSRELQGIEELIHNYPGVKIQLIVLKNETKIRHNTFTRAYNHPKDRKMLENELDINIGKKDIVKKLKHNKTLLGKFNKKIVEKIKNLPALLQKYPIIEERNETMSKYFAGTPLYSTWRYLSLDMVEFAVRVIQLWDFGGISFKLPKINTSRSGKEVQVFQGIGPDDLPLEESWRIESLLRSNLTSFIGLPTGVVNIDYQGLHMETKTPCHAFFGEMLMNIRAATSNNTVEHIVVSTLKSFCLSGAVSDEYCFNFADSE